MKKLISVFIVIFWYSICFSLETLMPPPVSVINWHENMRVLNLRGTYISMKPTEKKDFDYKITGLGLSGDYNFAVNDKCGFSCNFFTNGFNAEAKDNYSNYYMDFSFSGLNPNYVYEVVGGEEKDIAGEITKTGFSWINYFGCGVYWFSMGSKAQSIRSGREQKDSPFKFKMKTFQIGSVMEIPLSFWISFVPSYSGMQAYSYTAEMGGEKYEYENYDAPWMYTYGFDIFIRPFRLNPNLKISAGLLTQLVKANSNDDSGVKTTLIMIGMQYEWGKHYSSLLVGPGITK